MQPTSFLKTMTIIHSSLCLGLILFTAFVFIQGDGFEALMNNGVWVFVIPLTAMIAYFGSTWIFQNLIRNVPETEVLSKKLQRYRVALLIKYAIIEAASFLALIGYFFSGNAMHLVISLCLTAYLIFQRPTIKKLHQELPLNLEEKKEFDTLSSN